jgi:hypothetical protein
MREPNYESLIEFLKQTGDLQRFLREFIAEEIITAIRPADFCAALPSPPAAPFFRSVLLFTIGPTH